MSPNETQSKIDRLLSGYSPNHKKTNIVKAYIIAGVCLFLAAMLFLSQAAQGATPNYDPYADSVNSSSAGVVSADNSTGAPNGTMAQMAGLNAILTLDMGEGEEGTQTLKVHFGQINAVVNATVEFLDNNQTVIVSRSVQLGVDLNPSTQNFEYNWTNFGKAYRYVRLSTSQASASVNVDAVEALGFIGSTPTQDTDGDGISDRTEQQNGTDPLVPDPSNNGGGSSGGGGSGTSGTPPASTRTGSNSQGASAQVNAPPATNNDTDGDGMPNDWETAHGLNPNDKSDAEQDPDKDDLNNLTEYQIGSDPQNSDTDGDGMPDGWEHLHGLDVLVNDANGDPDGDFLTNLGEYAHNTDPQKSDNLYDVFGRPCPVTKEKMAGWDWFIFICLLIGAALSWLFAWKERSSKRSSET